MPKPQHYPQSTIPNDHYTERGFIRGVPGVHPDIRFTYRPMTVMALGSLYTACERLQDYGQRHKLRAEVIVDKAKYLKEWDIPDGKGGVLAVTAANLLRQKPNAYSRIVGIIMGDERSDPDENAAHLEHEATAEDLIAVAMGSGGESAEEIDAKN